LFYKSSLLTFQCKVLQLINPFIAHLCPQSKKKVFFYRDMVLLRIRSSEGTWRIEVDETSSVGALKNLVRKEFLARKSLHVSGLELFRNVKKTQLLADDDEIPLLACAVSRGDLIYLNFCQEEDRTVVSSRVADTSKCASCGPNSLCISCMVERRVAIRNWDKSCARLAPIACSFGNGCAALFAQFPHSLAYSIQRVGVLYGRFVDADPGEEDDEDDQEQKQSNSGSYASASSSSSSEPKRKKRVARVEAIHEPSQMCNDGVATLVDNAKESNAVEHVAELFGLGVVGVIFSRRALDEDLLLSADEMLMVGSLWNESSDDPMVVALSCPTVEGPPTVQVYELSNQFLELQARGLFAKPTRPDYLPTTSDVFVNVDYLRQVEPNFFLLFRGVRVHTDGMFRVGFPVESRNEPQLRTDLKEALQSAAGNTAKVLATLKDFHLLLFIATTFDIATLSQVVASILMGEPLDQHTSMRLMQ
jgi:Nuclear pore localisation protein NPL4/NPL4 family